MADVRMNTGAMVFIVDDDEAVRKSVQLLMKSVGYESKTYASADEFLAGYDASVDGCLVLDVRMRGMSGLDLQHKLNEMDARLPIIFITGHGDVPMAVQAVQCGAMGFLQKPFRDQELIDKVNEAVESVVNNQKSQDEKQQAFARLSLLTPREREILDYLVDGQANKAIAIDLGLSQRTVEVHRKHIMEKLQVRSVAQLVRLVLESEVGKP